MRKWSKAPRILSLLAVMIAAAVGFAPAAHAAEGDVVAKIGNVEYASLQEAVEAAEKSPTGATVELVDNVTMPKGHYLKMHTENANVTLDLKGFKVLVDAPDTISISEGSNISLVVKNGAIENVNQKGYGLYVYGNPAVTNINVTLENLRLRTLDQAVGVNGNNVNNNVTLRACNIDAPGTLGAYWPPKSGVLTIENTVINAGTGICVKGGSVVVRGEATKVVATGAKVVPDDYYTGDPNENLVLTGDAIYIESGYNDRGIKVEVSSGEIKSAQANSMNYFVKQGEDSKPRVIEALGGTYSDISVLAFVGDNVAFKTGAGFKVMTAQNAEAAGALASVTTADGKKVYFTSQKEAEEFATENPGADGKPQVTVFVATVIKSDGTEVSYGSLEKAIRAAEKGETIKLNQDIKVGLWNQIFADSVPSKLDGLKIDGQGHVLTIDRLESGSNGNYLLYEAKSLTVKNLTINQPKNANGFDMASGSLANVTFNGGGMGACLGEGDVAVDGCTFNGVSHALYTEALTGKVEVKNSRFEACGYVAILKKPGSSFIDNTVSGGKLNVMRADQKVQGNKFENGSRIKFYADSNEGSFSKNSISKDSKVALGDGVKAPNLNGNYWGAEDGPATNQLPGGVTVGTWYEDEGMLHLNTDPDIFKVTFVLGNGEPDKVVDVEEGKTVAKPVDPVRKGYKFAGWFSDAAFEHEFDFSATVAADATAYAKWIKDEAQATIIHKVTFIPVVSIDKVIVVEVEDGSHVKLPETPKVDGYTFAGWFFDKELKEPFDAEKTVITADTTLYGGWLKNGVDGSVSSQKPVAKPTLPKTGDASIFPMMVAGISGVAALAAASKRRKH